MKRYVSEAGSASVFRQSNHSFGLTGLCCRVTGNSSVLRSSLDSAFFVSEDGIKAAFLNLVLHSKTRRWMDEVQRKKIMSLFLSGRWNISIWWKGWIPCIADRLLIPTEFVGLLNENLEGFRDTLRFTTGVTGHAHFRTAVKFFWARSKRQLLKCAFSCDEPGWLSRYSE